jgi:hypothetical protein
MQFDSLAPNYSEARWWFVWLDTFTPSMLADDMGIHPDLAERFVAAGLWHGIIESTGDSINGRGPREAIYRYKPLPAGPRFHPHHLPEWKATPGCYSLAQATGMPVRIRSDRDTRRLLSTPGSRHLMKLRESAYRKQEEARQKAVEQAAIKSAKAVPKWMKKKRGSTPT